jgi:hypothetical protein
MLGTMMITIVGISTMDNPSQKEIVPDTEWLVVSVT